MLPLLAGALAGLQWGATGAAIAGGITGLLLNKDDPLGGAAMGALGGYGGGELAGALKGAGAAGAGTGAIPETVSPAMVGGADISNTLGANYLAGDIPGAMVATPIGQGGLGYGMAGSAPTGIATQAAPQMGFGESLASAGRGLGGLFQEGGFDKFKTALGGAEGPATTGQAALALGMPAFNVANSLGVFDPQGVGPVEEEDDKYKRDGGLFLYGPKSSPALSLYANGGTVQTGGLMDLYGASDAQYGPPISQQGYGIGRLNTLASQASQAKAEMGSYAEGGTPKLEDGGFVVPADVVFYLGGHDTEEGQAKLSEKFEGVPIRGAGNGLSDDIETSIEGREPAKVADGEVYIPRRIVAQHGGPEKFYKMMDRVRKQATGSTKQAREATV